MIGQTKELAVDVYPLLISHLEYVIKAVARRAGPSLCGRPQDPVKAVSSTLNFGSPRPPLERPPDGFETV
jgi:hypothetical protein